MPTVYVGIDIEEIAFIPVMKVVKSLEGVARVHMDFDSMFPEKKKAKAKANGNGAAPKKPEGKRDGIKNIVLMALYDGPAGSGDLMPRIVAAGYSKTSLPVALNELQRSGHIERKDGLYYLTEACRTAMDAHRGEVLVPAKALPAPEPEAAPEPPSSKLPAKTRALAIALRVLCTREDATPLKFMQDAIVAEKLPVKALQNAMADLSREKMITRVGNALYAPTAKARRQHANMS